MTKYFWMTYDLGIGGDYESLYAWLDEHEAIECGDGAAFIREYPYAEDFKAELKADLLRVIGNNEKARMYIIHYKHDSGKSVSNGFFLFGSRKRNPWEGYALCGETLEDEVLIE